MNLSLSIFAAFGFALICLKFMSRIWYRIIFSSAFTLIAAFIAGQLFVLSKPHPLKSIVSYCVYGGAEFFAKKGSIVTLVVFFFAFAVGYFAIYSGISRIRQLKSFAGYALALIGTILVLIFMSFIYTMQTGYFCYY